jgi:hypothetical protein
MIQTQLIKDFANVVSFGISLLSIHTLLNYYIYNNLDYLTPTINLIMFQCSYDIFLWHTDSSVLHHMFLLMIGSSMYLNNIAYESCPDLIIPLLSTEISTIFLVAKNWIEDFKMSHTIWSSLNNVCFVSTFMVTRIYIISVYLVYNPGTYQFIGQSTGNYTIVPLYIGIFGLYALNIFWATIIAKVLFKPLKEVAQHHYARLIVTAGPIINVLICLYCYEFTINTHVIGCALFALSSSVLNYFYILHRNQSHDIIILYLLNHFFLQIKCVLCVYAFHGELFGLISMSYHLYYMTLALYMNNLTFGVTGKIILTTILFPAIAINCFIIEFIPLSFLILFSCLVLTKYSYPLISITERELLLMPIVVDVLFATLASPEGDLTTRINIVLITYCMMVILYIKPLYNYNTVLLYVLSFVCDYMLCMSY